MSNYKFQKKNVKDICKQIMKKILGAIYWIVLVIVILVAASLFLSNAKTPINYRVFSVESGSMSPTIKIGSVVVILPKDSYSEGGIVTFRSETETKRTVTHRIVKVEKDEDIGKVEYQTKGDANEEPDMELVDSSRVLGEVVVVIPLFGYVVSFAKTQTGFVALVVIPATLIIYTELASIVSEIKKKIRKAKEQETDKKDLIDLKEENLEEKNSKKQSKKKTKKKK